MLLAQADNPTVWPRWDFQSRRRLVGHSAIPSLGTGRLNACHQISNGPLELAEPMRHVRRNHDYIARPHPPAFATLNGASDAWAGGFRSEVHRFPIHQRASGLKHSRASEDLIDLRHPVVQQ